MTVAEFHVEFSRLVKNGHGAKDVGLPEGFHGSGNAPGERIIFTVEENVALEDRHPGFVWIDIKKREIPK